MKSLYISKGEKGRGGFQRKIKPLFIVSCFIEGNHHTFTLTIKYCCLTILFLEMAADSVVSEAGDVFPMSTRSARYIQELTGDPAVIGRISAVSSHFDIWPISNSSEY